MNQTSRPWPRDSRRSARQSFQICGHLNTVPDVDGIAGQLLDIPEATAAIVDGLLDKTQPITRNTTNWFCGKPLFAGTKLCK